jgi:dephospho-CoA kinase
MIVGLTGGIGSGKSVIAKQLREMGFAVYDTDSEAKRLIIEDTSVRKQMEELFGKEVYTDGVYQTALVAQRVFSNKALLLQLNAIVHPAVKADILRWAEANKNDILFVECAILYQAGFHTICNKVVAVTAPEEVRINRVIARDHTTIDKVRARMRAQEAEKDILHADLVVNNDGKIEIMTICLQIRDFFCNFAG